MHINILNTHSGKNGGMNDKKYNVDKNLKICDIRMTRWVPDLHSHVPVDSHILGLGLVLEEGIVEDLVINVHFPCFSGHVRASQ